MNLRAKSACAITVQSDALLNFACLKRRVYLGASARVQFIVGVSGTARL